MKPFYTITFTLLVFIISIPVQLYGQQSFQLNSIDSQSKQMTASTLSGDEQQRIYFSLNETPIQRSEIQKGDVIEVQTSASSSSALEISRVEKYTQNSTSYIAKDLINPENTFTFTYSDGRMHGLFHKAHDDVYFFEYDSDSEQNYLAKRSSYYDDVHSCSIHEVENDQLNFSTPLQMGKIGMNGIDTSPHVPNVSASVATLEDEVTIDILMPYTPKARSWAENSSYGSIDAVLAASIANSQTALDNSNIFITIRLVHYYETDYDDDSSTSLNSDDPDFVGAGEHLRRLTYNPDAPINFCSQDDSECSPSDYAGFMEDAHTLRDEYGADLVAAVLSEPNTGGIAWLNGTPAGNSLLGFSVNRVQQIGGGYTLIHEIGHNMGNAHARNQNTAVAGDFGGLFVYSTGNRYRVDGNRYSTVMAYDEGGYQNIPFFSNPNVSFSGRQTGNSITFGGDAGPSDSARSMREIKRVIAAYRPTMVDPPAIDVEESNITASLDQENRTVTVPVTIQNNGSGDLLWDFDFDIQSGVIATKSNTSTSQMVMTPVSDIADLSFTGSHFAAAELTGEIFKQNFELLDGFGPGDFAALSGWLSLAQDTPFEISNENPSVGMQHLRLPRRSGSSTSTFARSPFFGPQPMGEYAIRFDVATEVPAAGSGDPLFDMYAFDTSTNSIAAGFIINDEGNIFARSINESGEDNFSSTGVTLPDDGEYRAFEILFNPNNGTIDYYLDGEQIASNPYPLGRKPDFMYFGQRNTISGAYMDIDNIRVERVHSPFNWLTAQKFGGVIPAGGSESVELTLTAQDVPTGSYQTVLQVKSNDPGNPIIEIPISADIEMATSSEPGEEVPNRVELRQNFPNPFNPTTNIQFTLDRAADVTLEVFNITGQKVATLIRGTLNAGSHQQTFDASGLSSGLYIYRLQTPEQSFTRQMILIK